ncbi:hypothetical protein [Streptomyces olivoreticuli]|uniref:hypothetical protein n=1 Tax=Streptomyces olivoreticuli TaxID=68246 RepID=UPI0034633994
MDDVQFGAVPVALGTSAHSDSKVVLTAGLVGRDIGKNLRVVTGDHPAIGVLDVDHSEVSCGSACMHSAELPEDPDGLLGKVSIGSGKHHTDAMFEQHPRFARVGEKALSDIDEYLGIHGDHHAAEPRHTVTID